MAFVSADWSTIIVLFLLFLSENALLTSSKNAGTSNSSNKKNNGSQRVTLNTDNPFLNKYPTTADYHDNPFFTVTSTLAASYLSGNTDTHNSESNPFLTEYNKPDNVYSNDPDYIHNPFLTSIKETDKNNNPFTSDLAHSLNQNGNSFNLFINSHTTNENINIDLSPAHETANEANRPDISDIHYNKEERSSTIPEGQPPKPLIVPSLGLFDKQSTRTKSDVKCEEYGKQFVGTAEVQFLVGTNTQSVKVENERCAAPDRLITGGTITAPGEFPHMVGLGKILEDGSFMFYCGGTLISPSWVLTAAHCTHGPNGGPTLAKIGFHDINDNKTGTDIIIKRAIRHPSYKPPAMYADIALIELQTTVTFSTLIKPACLYQLYDTVPMKVWVSGWGVTEYGGEQSNKLQKAQLNVIDNIACSMRHNTSIAVPYGVTPSMICAGDPHGGWMKDTCQGDSGGPLQVPHPKYLCLFQIIGITSFGEGCAIVNSPGVYTRVSHYLNWIEDTVWPNN